MGLYYINLKKYKKALNSLLEAEKITRATNDAERYAKVKGNLAKYYSEIGKTDQAHQLLQEDLKISKAIKNDKNTTYALIELSRLTL